MAVARPNLLLALLASAVVAMVSPAQANDIFIGTLSIEGDAVVLKRCDAAQNAYLLRDADDADDAGAVAALRRQPPASKGYWYGEVIGEYVEIDGRDGLLVSTIESIEADRSCHLLDVLGNIEAPPVDRQAEPADDAVSATRSNSDD
jgi:hypothetical protein